MIYRVVFLSLFYEVCPMVTFEKQNIHAQDCVTIHCQTKLDIKAGKLLWFKNITWNENAKEFEGTIVYSSTADSHADPQFKDRASMKQGSDNDCSLVIVNLRQNDTGNYTVRYIGKDKWKSEVDVTLNVKENACMVKIEEQPLVMENTKVKLNCSNTGLCKSIPEWHLPGEDLNGRLQQQISSDNRSRFLIFNATWRDDGKTLICKPPESEECAFRNITLAVEYSPKETNVTVTPPEVKEGDTVTLVCTSRGKPEPTYSWFGVGFKMSHDKAELKVNHIDSQKGGTYVCEARNKYGAENATTTIDVQYAPKNVRISQLPSNPIKEGITVTLSCNVGSSNPQPTYKWQKNHTYQVHQTLQEWKFNSVKPQDAGIYKCIASNSVSSTHSESIKVVVSYGPRNTEVNCSSSSCKNNTVKLGFSLTLSCVADSYPLPRYTWYRIDTQETLMLPETTGSLERNVINVSDAGNYMCGAANDYGARNSSAVNIAVLYAPRKPILSMERVVNEDQNTVIHCTVESFPISELQLMHTSNGMEKHLPQNVSNVPNSLKVSFKVSVGDAGTYICIANNSEGMEMTKQELVVRYSPKHTRAMANPGTEVKENEKLELTCKAQAHPSVSIYSWLKSARGQMLKLGNSSTLTLGAMSVNDSGWYTCETENEIGKGKSNSLFVRVLYGPKHTDIIHNSTGSGHIIYVSDRPVAMTCSSRSDPPVNSYKWYRKTDESKPHFITEKQNLTVSPDKLGTYYCIAQNTISSNESDKMELSSKWHPLHVLLLSLLIGLFCLLVALVGCLTYRTQVTKWTQRDPDGRDPHPRCMNFLGPRNGTRENLMMEGMGEPQRSQEDLVAGLVPYQENRANWHRSDSSPCIKDQTVYSILQFPGTTPKSVDIGGQPTCPPERDEDKYAGAHVVNYASLNFPVKGILHSTTEADPKTADCVYAKVSKPRRNSEDEEKQDYENMKELRTAWQAADTDSKTSEDEVSYAAVSVKPQNRPPGQRRGHQRGDSEQSSDDDDYRTQYSDIKA